MAVLRHDVGTVEPVSLGHQGWCLGALPPSIALAAMEAGHGVCVFYLYGDTMQDLLAHIRSRRLVTRSCWPSLFPSIPWDEFLTMPHAQDGWLARHSTERPHQGCDN